MGNVFCFACPFNFARELGRRILPARWSWPRRLRSKWIAIALLFSSSGLTKRSACGRARVARLCWWLVTSQPQSLLMVSLKVRASASTYVPSVNISSFSLSFRRSKWVFAISMSAARVKRMIAFAETTSSADANCNSSSHAKRATWIAPSVSTVSTPARMRTSRCWLLFPELNWSRLREAQTSAIRFFRRFDIAVLIFLLVFAAFINAGGMVVSVQSWERSLQTSFGVGSIQPVLGVSYLLSILVVPVLLVSRLCLVLQNSWPNTRRMERDSFDICAGVRAGRLQYVADSFLLSPVEQWANGSTSYPACRHGCGN